MISIFSDDKVGRQEAVEIWLAGVEQHNRSLQFKNPAKDNRPLHINEIRQMYGYLAKRASQIDDFDIRIQVRNWLDIHRHNMEAMRS